MGVPDSADSPTLVGDGTTQPISDQPAPSLVGRFQILRLVGRGGSGSVYVAYDPELDRRVAIKLLHVVGDEASARVQREAQAMARLSHPNVVQVFEVGRHERAMFIAMEYVDGVTLLRWQDQTKRSPAAIIDAYLAAGRGLAAAHAVDLVHRDFKPQNVMVSDEVDGSVRVRVLDFGLVTSASAESRHDGHVQGTPAYMSPEQLSNDDVDARADQFAFCVSLWEALHGTAPFVGSTVAEIVAARLADRVVAPRRAGLDPAVGRVLERGVARKPEERFASMTELLAALELARDRRRRWTRRGVAAVGVVGLVAVAGLMRSDPPCTGARQQVEEVWNRSVRDGVEAALTATELSYEATVRSRVLATLDAYADAWVVQHTSACEATAVHGEQSNAVLDLRMACLHRGRRSLAAAVDVLSTTDTRVVGSATEVLDGLASLDACEDVDALRTLGLGAPPAEQAEVVARVRDVLARAKAQLSAGRRDEAKALLDQALAESLTYEPALAERALMHGRWLSAVSRADDAEGHLESALRLAIANHYDEVVFDAAVLLMRTIGYGRDGPNRARQLLPIAEGLADGDVRRRAEYESVVAELLLRDDALDEAKVAFERALATWNTVPDRPPERGALIRAKLGDALKAAGRTDEALEHLELARAELVDGLGSDHWYVASVDVSIAMVDAHRGDFEQADKRYDRALEVLRETWDSAHPAVILALQGKIESQRQRVGDDAAVEWSRELVEATAATWGPNSNRMSGARNALANALITAKRWEEAETELRAAIALDDPDSTDDASLTHRTNLAGVLSELGHLDAAEEEQRWLVEQSTARYGPMDERTVIRRLNLATTLSRKGEGEAAAEYFRSGVAALDAIYGPSHSRNLRVRSSLVVVLLNLGEAEEAREVAEVAWEAHTRAELGHRRLADLAQTVSRALLESGASRDRATEIAQIAVAEYEAAGLPEYAARMRARFDLAQ